MQPVHMVALGSGRRRGSSPAWRASGGGQHSRAKHGFWLLLDTRELFLSFDQFPWFKEATIDAILNLERPAPEHQRWPDLDVDLALDSIEHPERYPLRSKL